MTDELELLRRYRGEPDHPTGTAMAAARAALDQAIEHERRPARRGVHGWPSGSRWIVRVAVVLAAAVVALVLAGALRSGSTAGPPPALAAPTVLERLAHVAARQGGDVPGPGQYLYTASHSLTQSFTQVKRGVTCYSEVQEYRQNWISADGRGLVRETTGSPHYLSPQSAAGCSSAPYGGGAPRGTSNMWAAPGCLSINPIALGSLTHDPRRLRGRLLTGKVEGGPPGAAEAFTQVGDLLRETDASPALRAALYRAAAGLPGVKYLGTITDHLGRRGLGLAVDSHGIRHELIFSASTSALLGEQGVLVGRAQGVKARRGTVLYWSAYDASRVVDQLPVSSPLPLSPACVKGASTFRSVPGQPLDSVIVGASAAKRLHAAGRP